MRILTAFLFLASSITVAAQSSPPVPVSPSQDTVMDNGCTDRSDPIEWNYEWMAVAGATEYQLHVKRNGARLTLVNIRTQERHYSRREPGAYIVPPNYSDWRWRVRAFADNKWTDWSDERTFSVEPLDTDCR